nr:hypothetical protein GCM10025699_33390 [Microbacterium flavescens]
MTTQQMLDERYGRTRSPARRWIIGVAIAVAAAVVALFGWFTVSGSLDAVDVDTTGFEVVDEHSVTVSFQVTAPRGAPSRVRSRRRTASTASWGGAWWRSLPARATPSLCESSFPPRLRPPQVLSTPAG